MHHHRAGLDRRLTQRKLPAEAKEKLISALLTDYRTANLTNREKTMLEYSEKLTLTPKSICADDIEKLKTVGFDDRAIHDICAVTAYFAFVNRMADGLGVELEIDNPKNNPNHLK